MSARSIFLLVLLLPVFALAQQPTTAIAPAQPNAPTLAVLLANRPPHITQEQWLRMMQEPVNRTLYPLRVTKDESGKQDGKQLDIRYQYVMVREMR